MTALRTIREKNILPPLLVLEILKDQHRLKFRVLKEFLLENLKSQMKQINRSKEKLDKDMKDIKTYFLNKHYDFKNPLCQTCPDIECLFTEGTYNFPEEITICAR